MKTRESGVFIIFLVVFSIDLINDMVSGVKVNIVVFNKTCIQENLLPAYTYIYIHYCDYMNRFVNLCRSVIIDINLSALSRIVDYRGFFTESYPRVDTHTLRASGFIVDWYLDPWTLGIRVTGDMFGIEYNKDQS